MDSLRINKTALTKIEIDFIDFLEKRHSGKVVVFCGTTIYGFYNNYKDAFQARVVGRRIITKLGKCINPDCCKKKGL